MLQQISGPQHRSGLTFQSGTEASIFEAAVRAAMASAISLQVPSTATIPREVQAIVRTRGPKIRPVFIPSPFPCAVCSATTMPSAIPKSAEKLAVAQTDNVTDTSDYDLSQGGLSTSTGMRPGHVGPKDEESTTSDQGVQISSSVCSSVTEPTHTCTHSITAAFPASLQLKFPKSLNLYAITPEPASAEAERSSPISPEQKSSPQEISKTFEERSFLPTRFPQGRLLHTASESNILSARITPGFVTSSGHWEWRGKYRPPMGFAPPGMIPPRPKPRVSSTAPTPSTHVYYNVPGPSASTGPSGTRAQRGEGRGGFSLTRIRNLFRRISIGPLGRRQEPRVTYTAEGGRATIVMGEERKTQLTPSTGGRKTASAAYMPAQPAQAGRPPSFRRPSSGSREARVEARKHLIPQRRRRCIYCGTNFINEPRFNRVGDCLKARDASSRFIDQVTCLICIRRVYSHPPKCLKCIGVTEGSAAAIEMEDSMCVCEEPYCTRPNTIRWFLLGLAALFVPCLWCYWPLRGCRRCLMCCHVCGPRHQAARYA